MLTEVKIDISYDFFFSIIQNTIDYIESVPNFKWKAIVVGILASVGKCTHPPYSIATLKPACSIGLNYIESLNESFEIWCH